MNKILKDFLNWLLSIFIAIVFVFFLKTFIGMPTTITGSSMVPTFYSNEKLNTPVKIVMVKLVLQSSNLILINKRI